MAGLLPIQGQALDVVPRESMTGPCACRCLTRLILEQHLSQQHMTHNWSPALTGLQQLPAAFELARAFPAGAGSLQCGYGLDGLGNLPGIGCQQPTNWLLLTNSTTGITNTLFDTRE